MAAFRAQVAVHMGIFREESGWAMLCSLRDADVDFSTLQKVWKLEPPCWKLSPAKWHAASLAAYSLPISMLPCYLFWVSSRNIQQNWWLMIDGWWWLPCCLKPENVSSQSTGRDELASVRSLSHQFRYRSVWIIAAKVAPAVTSAGMLRSLGLVQQSPAIERNHQYNPGRIIMYYWITCAVSLQPTLNSSQLVHVHGPWMSTVHTSGGCSCKL